MASWCLAQLFYIYLHNIPSPQKDLERQQFLHLYPILYVVVFRLFVYKVLIFIVMSVVADYYYYYYLYCKLNYISINKIWFDL